MILQLLTKLVIGERLDNMPMHKVVEMSEQNKLTVRECERLMKLERQSRGYFR